MKRFINIGQQISLDEDCADQFSFYCTVTGYFDSFNGEQVWSNACDFERDYLSDGRKHLDRYMYLIPNEFKSIGDI
jgi:hypothetical protein